jgi:F-type H+-transporting ATPase subunit delta
MKPTKQTRREGKLLFRLCLVNGLLDEARARQVMQQIAVAKPRGCLALLVYFRRLVALDSLRHTAKVESALPLPSDLQATVQEDLAQIYGSGLNISFTENPALIGGMRIQVGSDVYDRSVLARLTSLEQTF